MVGTNLKAETMSLMEQRDTIEQEMNAIISSLCCPGGPGISGNLLDLEGFPRSDIDISAVRSDRRKLSELRNDYKDITEKIDVNLQVLHSARLGQSSPLDPKKSGECEESINQVSDGFDAIASASRHGAIAGNILTPMDVEPILGVPFAMVDEITDGSPAAEDGVQLGDQIVKFGNVESGDGLLQRLAAEAQSNQGRAIPIVVMRLGELINFTVTPRAWPGRGLLGLPRRQGKGCFDDSEPSWWLYHDIN